MCQEFKRLRKDLFRASSDVEVAAIEEGQLKVFENSLIEELLFFVSEPAMIRERDATRRALLWIREIGEQAALPSMANLEDEGGEDLLKSLSTYSVGCVSTKKDGV